MDEHALKVLEYPALLEALAGCAQSVPGKAAALSLAPCLERQAAERELALTSEGKSLLNESPPDLSVLADTGSSLDKLRAGGSVLEPLELLGVLAVQKAARSAKGAVRGLGRRAPLLTALLAGLVLLPEWEEWVGRSLNEAGEVGDSASPELAKARREMRHARETVIRKLESFLGEERIAKVAREDYVTLRSGRYVIPVKPEYQRAFKAVVQDSSQSGQTLFVEPLFAVELNNKLAQAVAREEDEVRRVLAAWSDGLRPHRDELRQNLLSLAGLDLILAKARLGKKLHGVFPELDTSECALRTARHPLLALRPGGGCVPIDLEVGGDRPILVVTGPNTGGKTVALKTLGLLTLMAQGGIPVPAAEGSRLRVFTDIFADIGDEQSLSQNLSTFSAHLAVISRVLAGAGPSTLVLLDELGAGTDPQEGSALGIAILEALHAKGACAVATTHHNPLKEFAFRSEFARNASVLFDEETLLPTFRLRMGYAGRSHALEIAGRLGVEGPVVNRARELMGSESRQVDDLLGKLSEELDREARAREKAEDDARGLEKERILLKERLEKAREEMTRARGDAQRQLKLLLREVKAKGKDLLKEIRDGAVSTGAQLAERLAGMERETGGALGATEEPEQVSPEGRRGASIVPGVRVRVHPYGVEAVVEELLAGGREAEVSTGTVRLRAALADLVRLDGGEGDRVPVPGVSYQGEIASPEELNLLGCRVEDALERVDQALDRRVVSQAKRLRIVHGIGTGALKKAILKALREDPRVAACRPGGRGEGGAGVTVVELRE